MGRGRAGYRQICKTGDIEYQRLEVNDLHLSHAAGLFLLQGASLKQLLDDTLIIEISKDPGETMEAFNGILIFADVPALHRPPLVLKKAVFAHLTRYPANIPLSELTKALLLSELGS